MKTERMSMSMAPAQDPLAIAAQALLQAPYAEAGITVKLSYWLGHWHGDIVSVEHGEV